MIIFGSGGNTANLGAVNHRHCETCEREREYSLFLQYRYWGLYWIFNFITNKKYWLLCEICNRGWELHSSEVEKHLKASAIPFMHRFGLALLVGGLATLMIFSNFLGTNG